jgi:PilZ domain-containing protein
MEIKSRANERHAVGLPTSCQTQEGPRDGRWPAQIRDVSVSGVGLLLDRRFEPGTMLDFVLPDSAYDLPPSMPVRVVHASALPGGQWLLGCVFIKTLSEEELKRFLGQGKPAPQGDSPTKPAVPGGPMLNAFVVDQVFASWFGRAQAPGR